MEQEDIGGHEDGVHEQAGGDAGVGVMFGEGVAIDGGFVGVCAVEGAF